jgi:microcystin-dependent protein
MAYSAVPAVVTGQTYLASDYNTYIKDNLAALWQYTTAGDIVYATSSSTLARLGVGSNGKVLTVTSGLPAWETPATQLTLADVYPVGCIYTTTISTDPATVFGFGTWAAIGDGRVLVGNGTSDAAYTAGATGGESTHVLTEAELAAHTHLQNAHNHTQDAHTHLQNSHNHTQDAHNHTQNAHTHSVANQTETNFKEGTGATNVIPNNVAGNTGATTATNNAATATNQAATAVNQNATATNQAATAINQNAGSGTAHNNMPPYLVVYFWTRTA